MNQTKKLLIALKKSLKSRGITYRDVAAELELSEPSVKRLFSEESFSLHRLEQVCRMLGMSLLDLARVARMNESEHITVLSIEQETALANDPRLFASFYLFANEWTVKAVQRRFDLADMDMQKLLLKLDALRLIDLEPRNRVRPLTARTIQWRADGPVRTSYGEQVKASFLGSDFSDDDSWLGLQTAELSEASKKIMQRKIEKLERDFMELAETDLSLPLDQRQGVGLCVGFRPWSFFEWIIE